MPAIETTTNIFVCYRLPRKTDMERKIEIYNFATRTRQLFVRLLALVKWANSASKVEKSAVSFYKIIYMSWVASIHPRNSSSDNLYTVNF